MTEQLTLYPRVLLSSKIIDYQTPPELFEKLNREFNFDFDPCPKHNGGMVPYDGLITHLKAIRRIVKISVVPKAFSPSWYVIA